mmetsp:Transcript_26400/g.72585  ORF Transcript_26400/g.72585 Transcript_26400/m.72585 type:complete len:201 (+) Transcript_26400:2080-2682(+)
MVGSSIANEVVGTSARKESGLIVGCISNKIRCSWNSAPVVGSIGKRKGTDCDVVSQSVPHLVSIFQVYVCPTDVVQYIVFNSGAVGAMNNDSSLLGVFDGVSFEDALWTFFHFVKMQTIFSFDTSLTALFDANVLNLRQTTVHLNCVQSYVALISKGRTPAPKNRCLLSYNRFWQICIARDFFEIVAGDDDVTTQVHYFC